MSAEKYKSADSIAHNLVISLTPVNN